MIELSRRWFLFGSAATIATVTLPNVDPSLITQATSRHEAKLRKAYRLLFEPNSDADNALRLDVTRIGHGSSGLPILSMTISSRGSFMWRAIEEGDEIYLPNGHALGVSVVPDPGLDARLEITYENQAGDIFYEIFKWNGGVVSSELHQAGSVS